MSDVWETQSAFRRANEEMLDRRSELFDDETDAPAPFLCECADRRCTKVLRMPVVAYERIHSDRANFIVLPGHELSSEVERVVAQGNGFVVVRKLDIGTQVVSR